MQYDNDRSREIVASIIQLGESYNFKTVAEYLDNNEKKRRLHELDCDCLQGCLLSLTILCGELTAILAK